eukprot:6212078-Pleurochrysis_carterae.AAC.3
MVAGLMGTVRSARSRVHPHQPELARCSECRRADTSSTIALTGETLVDDAQVLAEKSSRADAVVAAVAQPKDSQMLRGLGGVGIVQRNRVDLLRAEASRIKGDHERDDVAAKEEGQLGHVAASWILKQQLLHHRCVGFKSEAAVFCRSNTQALFDLLDERGQLARRRADARHLDDVTRQVGVVEQHLRPIAIARSVKFAGKAQSPRRSGPSPATPSAAVRVACARNARALCRRAPPCSQAR